MIKKVSIQTLGCKVNQYESACIADGFQQRNYTLVDFPEPADVYVINTCTVTNRTDFKSRNSIRKALQHKESDPKVRIVVTGCFAQRQYAQVREMGDIDLVVDNQYKDMIPELLDSTEYKFTDIMEHHEFREMTTAGMPDRSRAFLKIQDGCDFYCAYCAVPYARGHSRSRDPEKVIQQVELLAANGYQEYVIGGINAGLYGLDLPKKTDLLTLLHRIGDVEGVERIRISSIEPQFLGSDFLSFLKTDTKLCPHLHISLQSGSDTILKAMRRKYDTSQFRSIIQQLKQIRPDIAIGMDVIVGFPGETDALFEETHNFLKSLDFTYLHVFPYSSRPGTAAAQMPYKVHGSIVTARTATLHDLHHQRHHAYRVALVENATPLAGVVEGREHGMFTGLSDHFIRFYCKEELPINRFGTFTPTRLFEDGVEVVPS